MAPLPRLRQRGPANRCWAPLLHLLCPGGDPAVWDAAGRGRGPAGLLPAPRHRSHRSHLPGELLQALVLGSGYLSYVPSQHVSSGPEMALRWREPPLSLPEEGVWGVRMDVWRLLAEVARAQGAGANSVSGALPADWLPALCPHPHIRVLLYGGLEQAGGHLLRRRDAHHGGVRGLCGR